MVCHPSSTRHSHHHKVYFWAMAWHSKSVHLICYKNGIDLFTTITVKSYYFKTTNICINDTCKSSYDAINKVADVGPTTKITIEKKGKQSERENKVRRQNKLTKCLQSYHKGKFRDSSPCTPIDSGVDYCLIALQHHQHSSFEGAPSIDSLRLAIFFCQLKSRTVLKCMHQHTVPCHSYIWSQVWHSTH